MCTYSCRSSDTITCSSIYTVLCVHTAVDQVILLHVVVYTVLCVHTAVDQVILLHVVVVYILYCVYIQL